MSQSLAKSLGIKNPHCIPKCEKVIVSIGIGSLATRKGVKDFTEVFSNLQKITGQKPFYIYSKKAVSNFKLREGMHSMIKVTLRKEKALSFLHKVSHIALLRVRDFVGLSKKSFDGMTGYSFGLKTFSVFPELHPDSITLDVGLQITIQTNTKNKAHMQAYFESLGFVFA